MSDSQLPVMEEMDCVNSWEEEAREIQQAFYLDFGDRDWDRYDANQREQLLRNVGFAVYGPPDEEPDAATNLGTGYNKVKLKHIEKLCEKFVQRDKSVDDTIDIAIIYVVIKLDDDRTHFPLPVFRVADGKRDIFIDSTPDCRTYNGWDNYLNHNQLPKCTYCYPSNGIYYGDADDRVILEISQTPACKLSKRLLVGADNVGVAMSVGATMLSVAALAVPVASSILLAAAVSEVAVGVYSMGRGLNSIVDRKQHQQSIGVKDAESRSAYIALGASVLGVVAAGATRVTATMASRGLLLSKSEQILINMTKVGSITANGIGILNGIFIMKEKSPTGETVSSLEIFQLTSALLFFMHSVVSFKSAKKIVRETQQDVIKSFETKLQSDRHRKEFRRAARNSREGLDAKFIQSLTNIGNSDELFSSVVRVEKQLDVTDHVAVQSEVCKAFGVNKWRDIVIDGVAVFAELQLLDVQRVCTMLRRSLSPQVLHTALQLARNLGFTRSADFVGFLDFASLKINGILYDMECAVTQGLKVINTNTPSFSKSDWQQHCLNTILSLYSAGKKCCELLSDYESYKETIHQAAECQPTAWNDTPNTKRALNSCWNEASSKRHKATSNGGFCLDRDFSRCGLLSHDDLYNIAAMATSRDANKFNAAIDFLDDHVATIHVMDMAEDDYVVLVSCDVEENTVLVQLLD